MKKISGHAITRWIVFFLGVALCNLFYIFDPIYWDMIVGMFAQSYWLAENQMNYSLLLQQPSYQFGGPLVYPFCWLPSLLFGGLFYAGLTVGPITVIGHVMVWVCATVVLDTTYRLVLKVWDHWTSAIACLALISCPLFLSHASQFSMEMPLAAVTILAFACNLDGRTKTSVALSILAFHLHPRGVVSILGNGSLVVMRWAFLVLNQKNMKPGNDESTKESRKLVWSAVLHFSALIVFVCYVKLFSPEILNKQSGIFSFNLKGFLSSIWCPEFFVASAFFAVKFVALRFQPTFKECWQSCCIREEKTHQNTPINSPKSGLGLLAGSAGFVVVYFVFMLTVKTVLLRYSLIIYPFLLVGFMAIWAIEKKSVNFTRAVLFVIVFLNLANYQGSLYRLALPDPGNNGHILERSMEYRSDMKLNQKLVDYIESNFDLPNTVFVTHWPITQILSIPEVGYGNSNKISVASDQPLSYSDVYSIGDLFEVGPQESTVIQKTEKDVVWILSDNVFSRVVSRAFPRSRPFFGPDEKLIAQIGEGSHELFLYRRAKVFESPDLARHLSKSSIRSTGN